MLRHGLLAALLLVACDGGAPADPGTDAGPGPGPRADAGPTPASPDAGPLPAATDAGASAVDAGAGPGGPLPGEAIDELSLVILIGDSAAAGYNASGRNGEGGHGFARLMLDNHPDYPSYAGHSLRARWPSLAFADVSESGATSADALSNLRGALRGGLPESVPGDVLVLINVGGNDFNDSILNIIDPGRTAAVSAEIRSNLAEMFRLLRERYENEGAGKRVVFLVDDLYDPTDGMGSIPPQFDDGFCEQLQNPLFVGTIRDTALMNLATLNAGTAEEVAAQGGHLVPVHDAFLGHGMNATTDRWLDGDCTHPTNGGHDAIRREMWAVLFGERL